MTLSTEPKFIYVENYCLHLLDSNHIYFLNCTIQVVIFLLLDSFLFKICVLNTPKYFSFDLFVSALSQLPPLTWTNSQTSNLKDTTEDTNMYCKYILSWLLPSSNSFCISSSIQVIFTCAHVMLFALTRLSPQYIFIVLPTQPQLPLIYPLIFSSCPVRPAKSAAFGTLKETTLPQPHFAFKIFAKVFTYN